MRPLSAREQRLVALLLLIVAIACVELLVIAPIVAGFQDRAATRALLLTRYQLNQRIVATIPRLRRAAERAGDATARFTIAAPDAGAADQALRERLQHAVDGAGGEFRGSESVPADAGWTAARLTARLTTPQLVTVLAALQNQTPYVVARALVVSADDALVTGQAAPLDVQIEITAPRRLARAG